MPSKDKKEKVKPVVWSSGRGGAGNISKAKNAQNKAPIDPDIRPQVKILELETARNRSTAGGRGGRGNRYDHVLEPGLFQRVMQHETARIVAAKAETEANRSTKMTTSRARSKSTVSNDSLHNFRSSTRLRSASTSTFGTSISGSSASPSNVSSSQYTRSVTPASSNSVATRLFSPVSWKKRVFGGGSSIDSTGTNSIWSTDDTSLHSVTLNISSPVPIAIPESYGERSSSMHALPTPMPSDSFSNPKTSRSIIPSTSRGSDSSTSLDCIPYTPSNSCSPPRVGPRPVPSPAPISTPNPNSVPVRPPRQTRPRGFALASGDRLAIYDRDFTSAPISRPFTRSNVDVSVAASPSASTSRGDGLDGYPFLVEGRIPDCQEPSFTAYHLPLRPNIVRHNFPMPTSRMRKESDSGVSFV